MQESEIQKIEVDQADGTGKEAHTRARGAYARTWWIATILLIVMSVLFLISSRFQGEFNWLNPIQAFAEAAMVGALADWFAVTALFRRPLGLPIPHTAVIPSNKSRIGKNLGYFIQTNFLSDRVLDGEVVNISGAAATWLGKVENRKSVVRRVRQLVPRLLETMEESEFRRFIDLQFEEFIRGVDLPKSTACVLRLLTANEMHEVFLDEVVKQTHSFFRSNEEWFRNQMREASPWFVPDFVDKKIAEAIISKTEQTFAAALADRKHELRLRVHAAMEQFIERLETAPEMQKRGEEVKKLLLSNEIVRRYINSIRDGIATTIKSDIARDDSQLAAAVDRALESFVVTMTSSRDVQKKLNMLLRRVLRTAFGDQSGHVAELISRTIDSWDTTTLVSKMEEQVGPDLQYIRINGTIVGGLVGLCLYLLETMIQRM